MAVRGVTGGTGWRGGARSVGEGGHGLGVCTSAVGEHRAAPTHTHVSGVPRRWGGCKLGGFSQHQSSPHRACPHCQTLLDAFGVTEPVLAQLRALGAGRAAGLRQAQSWGCALGRAGSSTRGARGSAVAAGRAPGTHPATSLPCFPQALPDLRPSPCARGMRLSPVPLAAPVCPPPAGCPPPASTAKTE